MTAAGSAQKVQLPWSRIIWFGLLIAGCYAPVLVALVKQWNDDPDMGHGFFVPLIVGFILWQRREELSLLKPAPDWRGLILVIWGGLQLMLATLGAELFLARTAIVITLTGVVWLLGGKLVLKKLAFPLFLLLLMIPIPAVIYNEITFPLQRLASRLAEDALSIISIPVLREGNVLELPNQRLSVVEACSGIRSLLSLTFLALVYGYFFEKRPSIRIVLLVSTVPIAIIANASRVTLTGILTEVKPEIAEGFFHLLEGWVIFIVAFAILLLFHQVLIRVMRFAGAKRVSA